MCEMPAVLINEAESITNYQIQLLTPYKGYTIVKCSEVDLNNVDVNGTVSYKIYFNHILQHVELTLKATLSWIDSAT